MGGVGDDARSREAWLWRKRAQVSSPDSPGMLMSSRIRRNAEAGRLFHGEFTVFSLVHRSTPGA